VASAGHAEYQEEYVPAQDAAPAPDDPVEALDESPAAEEEAVPDLELADPPAEVEEEAERQHELEILEEEEQVTPTPPSELPTPVIHAPDLTLAHPPEEVDEVERREEELEVWSELPSETEQEAQAELPQEDAVPEAPAAEEPEEAVPALEEAARLEEDEKEFENGSTPDIFEEKSAAQAGNDYVATAKINPSGSGVGDQTLELFQYEESEENMTAQETKCCLLLRVAKGSDQETLKLLVQQIQENVLAEGDSLAVAGPGELVADLGVTTFATGQVAEGAITADAIASAPDAAYLITVSSDVLLTPETIDNFRKALSQKGVVLAYSDYREDRDGALTDVKLHDHEGCPHERFEFGPVIGYCLKNVKKVGGIRRDLNFAWEYDTHLKLMEVGSFAHIRDFSYTRFIPVVVDEKGKKVFSPGMGPLGGFSYVFYPADVEKEVTSVFEEALKRRGCWIDHDFKTVNHSGKNYEVMATVVVPILNRVKYIGNAIQKVLDGTFDDFEMIIIDNGSKDGTIEEVKKYAEKDKRIRLIHGTGGSIASAINEGIRAARGKYICQLDSDDQYDPTTLEKMVGHFESHPKCGLAISYYCLMDENATVITDIPPVTHSGYTRNQILRRDGAGALRVFPKVVLEEFGLYDEEHYGNFGEDYDMVVKTGEWYSVDRVHEVLYYYRRHPDNTDVTRDPEMKYKNKNRARQEALKRRRKINEDLGKA
jgi:hypothetical protein